MKRGSKVLHAQRRGGKRTALRTVKSGNGLNFSLEEVYMKKFYAGTVVFLATVVFGMFLVSCKPSLDKGKEFAEKGDFDTAIAEFTDIIRRNPNYVEAYLERGRAYGANGNFNKAILDYTEAIRIQPDYTPVYYWRGNAYANDGNFKKAIADFKEVVKLDPNGQIGKDAREALRVLER